MQNARTGPTRLRAVSQPAWKRRRRRPAVARRRAPDSPCAAAAAARQHGSDSPRAAADEPWVTDRAAGGWVATPSPRSTRRPAVEPTSLPTHMRWPLAMWVLKSILRPPRRRSAVARAEGKHQLLLGIDFYQMRQTSTTRLKEGDDTGNS
ncbi:hypothetical protein U9M48_031006 [Paspalum notatum var. saurae]|uniref:Uncharacterized protein n=1 Tax=Paspalum notatum var. saurae TaxID=547442 RepID=A0AAQ3U1X4_PASNO